MLAPSFSKVGVCCIIFAFSVKCPNLKGPLLSQVYSSPLFKLQFFFRKAAASKACFIVEKRALGLKISALACYLFSQCDGVVYFP